jgi:hypothetical protein
MRKQKSETPIKKRRRKNDFIKEEQDLKLVISEAKEQNICSICYLDYD